MSKSGTPQRRFEQYTLTRYQLLSDAPSEIPPESFRYFASSSRDTPSTLTNRTALLADMSGSLGFDLDFAGTVYKRFTASTNGFLILHDPATAFTSAIATEDQCIDTTARYRSIAIMTTGSGFQANHTLLAPWFGYWMNNIAPNIAKMSSPITATDTIEHMMYGLTPYNRAVNAVHHGTKYFRGTSANDGKFVTVRWNTSNAFWSTDDSLRQIIQFESSIYESGKIEFRYTGRNSNCVSIRRYNSESTEASAAEATMGIFKCYRNANRWRDFSNILKYKNLSRSEYVLGGNTYNPNFVVSTNRTYYHYLSPLKNWPGTYRGATVYTFSPPRNQRVVLPRSFQRDLDNLPLTTRARAFEDNRTLVYTTTASYVASASYPMGTQRRIGDGTYDVGVELRQDLFRVPTIATASILVEDDIWSTTNKSASDPWLYPVEPQFARPYSEADNPNLIISHCSKYFATGTNLEVAGTSLLQPLSAKDQIFISLPIHNPTRMWTTRSCMYYYDKMAAQWLIPTGARADLTSTERLDDDAVYKMQPQDHRGFNAIGHFVVSGTLYDRVDNTVRGDSTNASGAEMIKANFASAMSANDYTNSVTLNENYNASDDQLIKLNIDKPFILEKAIIDVPFIFGPSWFTDRTEAFVALKPEPPQGLSTSHFQDLGGPGITVSLFNQLPGTGSLTRSKRRDLILSGVITHEYDNVSELIYTNFMPLSGVWALRPRGMLAYEATPAAVVHPGTNLVYTGSVQVKCEAAITNGCNTSWRKMYWGTTGGDAHAQEILGILTGSSTHDIFNVVKPTAGSHAYQSGGNRIAVEISPFGRAKTGFRPSGRSIFGQEFRLPVTENTLTVKQPLYIGHYQTGSLTIPAQMSSAFTSGSFVDTWAFAFTPLYHSASSPYLLMPGDNLVLAISKARPHYYMHYTCPLVARRGKLDGTYRFSGSRSTWGDESTYVSASHDVTLNTGHINITLFGSYLREENEQHYRNSTTNMTNAVFESVVVGNQPVLDQFEVEYRETSAGTAIDSIMTGTMVTNTNGIIIQDVRAKQAGNIFARLIANPLMAGGNTVSYGDTFVPWYEKAGINYFLQCTANNERVYDSLMPSVADVWRADGAGLVIFDPLSDWISQPFAMGVFGPSAYTISTAGKGGLFLESKTLNTAEQVDLNKIANWNWSHAFPFEPRYAGINRQQFVKDGFYADYKYLSDTAGGSTNHITLTPIEPTKFSGLYHVRQLPMQYGSPTSTTVAFRIQFDVWTTALTPPSIDDSTKIIYGFGDSNIREQTTSYASTYGYYGSVHRNGVRTSTLDSDGAKWRRYGGIKPVIRGWKYGVYSGLPAYSKSYWRVGRYGQFRDMLEQRLDTKYYTLQDAGFKSKQSGPTAAAVKVKFVDSNGRMTHPENTWSSNLSNEATSSLPYFDGEVRNRGDINTALINQNTFSLSEDVFSNVSL